MVPDLAEKLPGRGVWVGAKRELVLAARSRRLFSRALREPAARAEPGLEDRVEAALARRLAESLGLARKAGRLVAGFEKTRARLREARSARSSRPRMGLGADASSFARCSRRPPGSDAFRLPNSAPYSAAHTPCMQRSIPAALPPPSFGMPSGLMAFGRRRSILSAKMPHLDYPRRKVRERH